MAEQVQLIEDLLMRMSRKTSNDRIRFIGRAGGEEITRLKVAITTAIREIEKGRLDSAVQRLGDALDDAQNCKDLT